MPFVGLFEGDVPTVGRDPEARGTVHLLLGHIVGEAVGQPRFGVEGQPPAIGPELAVADKGQQLPVTRELRVDHIPGQHLPIDDGIAALGHQQHGGFLRPGIMGHPGLAQPLSLAPQLVVARQGVDTTGGDEHTPLAAGQV